MRVLEETQELTKHRASADEFFRNVLKSPRYVCAPMVRGSERAFRELVRRHGVSVCWGPMIRVDGTETLWHTTLTDAERRKIESDTGIDICTEENSPTIAQLGGCDAEKMILLSRYLAEKGAVAIDINMGCPQDCAKRGGFGAFLLDNLDVAVGLVERMHGSIPIPVLCKIRVLNTPEATVAFARRLEAAGCSVLTIHGRTRAAKHDGPVDLDTINRVASCVGIPVIANGGVSCKDEADFILSQYPLIKSVMLASGLLADPRMLSFPTRSVCLSRAIEMGYEYLVLAEQFPPPHFLYLQLHFRHMFRAHLKRDHNKWFTLLHRVYMSSTWHLMCYLRLLAIEFHVSAPDLSAYKDRDLLESFADLRRGFSGPEPGVAKDIFDDSDNEVTEISAEESCGGAFDLLFS